MTRRPIRLAAAGLLGALALTSCSSNPVRSGAAAVVGSDRISVDQLAQTVSAGLADPAAAQQLGADKPAYQRDVLGRIINADIVDEAARRQGVTLTAGDVDREYASIRDSVGGDEQLQKQAAQAGLTLDRVRDLARTRALVAALGEKLTQNIVVPPAQLQAAYAQGIDQFDQVRTAQIQQPTLAAAQKLLPQARRLSNAAFEDLARRVSTDTSTKANGGDLGLAPRSAFSQGGLEAYGRAAFAAKVGATFAVAFSRGGHVVRVLERKTVTLQQATPQLRANLLQQQRGQAVEKLLRDTAASMTIDVNPRFGVWDADKLTVADRNVGGEHQVSSPSAPSGGPSSDPSAAPDGSAPSQ